VVLSLLGISVSSVAYLYYIWKVRTYRHYKPLKISNYITDELDSTENNVHFMLATEYVKKLDLDDDTKLKFYGLYKQAIEGTCTIPEPSRIDFIAKAKWDNWKALGNMSKELAKDKYVELLTMHVPNWLHEAVPSDKSTTKSIKIAGPAFSRPIEEEKYEGPKDICFHAQAGNIPVVVRLLYEGVSPDSVDEEGVTPLMYACDRAYYDMAVALISRGAKLNIQDRSGDTALHYAVQCDHENMIDLLLTKGADPSIINEDGESAIDIAASETVREKLLKHNKIK